MSKAPKLRFKEFSGDWESKRLGELGEFFKGSTLSKTHLSEDGKPCVLYGELYTRYGEVIKSVISKTDLEESKLVIGQKNDVLIPSSGETAIDIATASCLQQDNVILGGDLNIFRSGKLNGVFTSYQLNNSKRHEIAKLAQGASVVHVYNNQLSKLRLSVPKLEEQEKIASFFSLIDDKISLQDEKVEALKDYKKGIMQKIFSRELRFKDDDGRDYPEWEEKKIKEMELYISDGNYGEAYPTSSDMVEEGVPFLRGNNINNGYLNFNDMKYITPEKHSELLSGHIKSEDIIITVRGDIGKVGFATCEYEGANMNAQLALIRVKCKKIDARYLHQYMNTAEFYKEVLKRQTGTALKQLPIGKLKDISLKLPNIEEQRKISLILCGLDSKLEKEQEKLDSLNKYKKGLLQQMFV